MIIESCATIYKTFVEKFSLTYSNFRTKWSKVLLAWLLMMVIYIFPEAGLVLFMSIYHWVRLIYYHTFITM